MTNSISSIREMEPPQSAFLDSLQRDLVNFLPESIIILDEAMQIVYINPFAECMFGYPAVEVLGQKLDIFLPGQYIGDHPDQFINFLVGENGACRLKENWLVHGKHRQGYLISLEMTITSRKYQDQEYIICIPRDNSVHLANKQALRESEQRYRGMIDSQTTLVVRLDREGRFLFANEAYCQMFGKNLDDLIGQSFAPLVHPDDLPKTLEAMQALETPPYRINIEQRALTSKGWRWIAWEDSLFQDPSRGIYEIQAVGVDITEHKDNQAELSNKIAQLSALLNSIPDIIFFKDAQGAYQGCNAEFARLVGKPVEEIVQKTDYDLFDRETADFFREHDRQMLEQGKQRQNEEWIKYPDGEQVLLDTLKAPMLDVQGRAIGIIGISRDITARKKMEEVAVIERNLAIILAQKSSLEEALPLCLDLALQFSEMDCGGIYLLDRQKQELVLMTHKGLSDGFVAQASKIENGSERYRLALSGAPLYQPYRELPTQKNPSSLSEGLHASAVIPARFNDEVIACINVASHSLDDMPKYRRRALENLANQIGSMIGRFQAQAELAESQQELQSMFNSLQDYVFVLDEQGCILQVNQKVMDSLGYSRAELIGNSVLKTHPTEQQATAWQIVQDMLAGLMDTCPLDLQRKDGSLIPVETKVARGRWGNREALIGVSRDISERIAADEARLKQTRLLEYRHKFEETLTSISTRFINLPSAEINPEINHVLKQIGEFEQVDRSYVFLVDQAAARMTNTHEWCLPGIETQIDQLQDIPTSLFPWWLEKLEKLEEVYIPIVSEMPAEAQAERELLALQSIQSVLVVPLVANNRMVGFLGFDSVKKQRLWSPDSILLIKMVGDILSNALMRFKMQSDLMQSESRNTALLSAVPDMIFRIRRDGVFLDYKATSTDFLAVSGDQIKGASLSSILPEALTGEAMILIEQALQTKEIQSMEYTLKIGDAAHVFEARIKDSGEDEVTAIVREISARARLEQMKSDFINQATHELRTPIATMLLMVNLINGDSTAEEFQQYWDILKSELSREQLLVENLLSAGRLENNQVDLHFRFMDITEILKQTIRQLELPAREKNLLLSLQITETLDEGVYILNVDENALSQVFVNLLGNAIKFTPAGGQVNIGLRSLNSGVEVSIRDSGIGIPSEDIPLLFNRFFRGSNAVQDEIPGTGIGLFIVRSILEKHSGSIKAHSTLGQGSQFDVWLPVDQT